MRAVEQFTANPILVRCTMGVSRSSATGLGILYWHSKRCGIVNPVEQIFRWLRQLGEFKPNARLARLLVEVIDSGQEKPFEQFRRHPQWHLKAEDDLYSKVLPKPMS